MPRRARYIVPAGFPRRDEVLAVCVVLTVLAHLLFAQLTMVLAVLFALITRVTRWRLSWLAAPVAAGLAWTAAAGPRAAAAGFADGPARVAAYLGAGGHQASHLLHFTGAFAAMSAWLPRQLPLAILAGAAEAALAGWLIWLHTDEQDVPPARPGLVAAARRAAAMRTIRTGGVLTRDGYCLGVTAGSGTRVTVSWPETAGGVCVSGSAGEDVLASSFQLVHAAVRRRKPVLAVDLTGDPGLPGRLAAVCAAAGAPLLVFDGARDRRGSAAGRADAAGRPACYEPFRYGDPARRAALVMAMLSWDGPGRRYRRSCAAYLEDVFELMDAAPGDPRIPVLDDVIHLLNPAAMRARMEYVPGLYPRREALAERARVSVSLASAEPATTAELARQLRALRASALGRWLRPPARGREDGIDLRRAVTDRAVVLFRLAGTAPATPGTREDGPAMLGRLVCQDLLATGAALNRIGVDGDGLIWLAECGLLPRRPVCEMIARGADTGLPVLASTTSAQAAAELADLVNVVVAHRTDAGPAAPARPAAPVGGAAPAAGTADPGMPPGDPGEDAAPGGGPALEAGALSPLRDGEFLLAVSRPRRLVPRALLVEARVPESARAGGLAGAPRHAWEGA